nr:MAG: protein of unknown function (DUF1353) [Bacteriophage sp.]
MTEFQFADMPVKYLVKEDQFQFLEDYVTPEVTIPKGFVTDGASIPRFIQNLYPPYYFYFPAAAVHDYMYTVGTVSRKDADATLRDNIRYRLKMSCRYWLVMWVFVRLFGGSHFTKKQEAGLDIR